MKLKNTNITLSLYNRERHDLYRCSEEIDNYLEHKTARNHSSHKTYHSAASSRSTFVITFNADKTLIATSHGNHTIKISNCYTCDVKHTLVGHLRTPWCIAFHPRIKTILASGCLGGQVRIWDLQNLYSDNLIYSSPSVISSLTFHPIDDVLVIATTNTIIFFDWNQKQTIKTIQTKHHSESIRFVRFLPGGNQLMTGIANTSSQYCKPTCLNVSTRGDPDTGQPVVQTVSCLRMQKRPPQRNCKQACNSSPSKKPKSSSSTEVNPSTDCNVTTRDRSCQTNFSCVDNQTVGTNTVHKTILPDNNVLTTGSSTNTVSNTCNNTPNKFNVKDNSQSSKPLDKGNQVSESEKADIDPNDKNETLSSSSNDAGASSESVTSCTDQNVKIHTKRQYSVPRKNRLIQSQNSTDSHSHLNCASGPSSDNNATAPLRPNIRQLHAESIPNTRVERQFICQDFQRRARQRFLRSTSSTSGSSSNDGDRDPQVEVVESVLARYQQPPLRTGRRHSRTEIWNFQLADAEGNPEEPLMASQEELDEIGISVQSSASTIPVHGFVSYPAIGGDSEHSASISNLSRHSAQTAVATATARSSHHVHTAVVIASQDDRQSEVALQTAVNRAIAGAFAGSGEGAVANNIIDTTHRLQLWDSRNKQVPNISSVDDNVVVPFCKIHNDASVDISQDGTLVAAFVPSSKGFPKDGQLEVISLRPESYLHCIYSRKYGPNAVSISLSPLNSYICVGLASRKLHWHATSQQLVAQVLHMPDEEMEIHDDCAKPASNIVHKCAHNQRSNVSVNTIRFHPRPGMGIFYGTNRGHIQHCQIGPDLSLSESKQN